MTLIGRRTALALGATGMASMMTGTGLAKTAPGPLVARYIDVWQRRDLEGMLACLTPDVHFKAPSGNIRGMDRFRPSAERFFTLLEKAVARASFVSEDRAMIAWDFVCREPIGVSATAELLSFRDGLISESEIFFDVRPFEAFNKANRRPQ